MQEAGPKSQQPMVFCLIPAHQMRSSGVPSAGSLPDVSVNGSLETTVSLIYLKTSPFCRSQD